jgi:hypothetical protein
MYPDFSDVTCPLDAIKPPLHELIRAGSAEQRFRFAFCRGAHDALRQAYRLCCPSCRTVITAIAATYRHEWEAA